MKLSSLLEATYHRHPVIAWVKNHIESPKLPRVTQYEHIFDTAQQARVAADALLDFLGEPIDVDEENTQWSVKDYLVVISHYMDGESGNRHLRNITFTKWGKGYKKK